MDVCKLTHATKSAVKFPRIMYYFSPRNDFFIKPEFNTQSRWFRGHFGGGNLNRIFDYPPICCHMWVESVVSIHRRRDTIMRWWKMEMGKKKSLSQHWIIWTRVQFGKNSKDTKIKFVPEEMLQIRIFFNRHSNYKTGISTYKSIT